MRSTHDEVDLNLVVARRRVVADGVVALELRHPSGQDLPAWTAGAHIDLRLGPTLVRQYSLCGDPADRSRWRLGVLREPDSRGGSRLIHDTLHEGVDVAVRGPRNHFQLLPSDRYLFIAGGIGITPILPMIREAEATGAEWRLLYGGRSLSTMAFRDEVEALGADRVQIRPQDTHGMLDLEPFLGAPRSDTLIYCCGPAPLLDAVEALAAAWPANALHMERFTPKQFAEPADQRPFEVELSLSGVTLTVPPDKSILDVIIDAGIDAPSSCGEGTCGTCETVVLEGQPDHRDSLMSPAEQEASETMMICVSRSKSPRLVLEL